MIKFKNRKNKKLSLELNYINNDKKKQIKSENNISDKKEEEKHNLLDRIPKLSLNKLNLNINKTEK